MMNEANTELLESAMTTNTHMQLFVSPLLYKMITLFTWDLSFSTSSFAISEPVSPIAVSKEVISDFKFGSNTSMVQCEVSASRASTTIYYVPSEALSREERVRSTECSTLTEASRALVSLPRTAKLNMFLYPELSSYQVVGCLAT